MAVWRVRGVFVLERGSESSEPARMVQIAIELSTRMLKALSHMAYNNTSNV